MKIEDEIKQQSFKSQYTKLLVNLLFTGNWIHHFNKKFLKGFQVSPEQYNVLRILRGRNPLPANINMLNERMLDKMSNVSRLVEKLRLKGLIIRKESEKDRRQVDIFITEEGLKLLDEVDKKLPQLELQFHSLNEEEATQLNNLLDKLRG